MSSAVPVTSPSIFRRRLDVVVHGGGHVGVAAARALAAGGLDVLLIEPSGQLLWESTRALENRLQGPEAGACAAWDAWRARLAGHDAARGGCFDVAFAEILAAREWTAPDAGAAALFYARPVALERDADGRVLAMTVATKSGLRTLRARRWIDASERGDLAALEGAGAEANTLAAHRRAPVALRHALVLQGDRAAWARHGEALTRFAARFGAELVGSVREGERRLAWTASAARPWHREMTDMLRALRGAANFGADLVVSQLSAEPFPLYGKNCATVAPRARATATAFGNLLVLSPALVSADADSIGARHRLGAEAARLSSDADEFSPPRDSDENGDATAEAETPAAPPPARTAHCDVLVAGTGTAGALAAIAAAKNGARTRAIDFASFPGGVGTGGGVTGYFYGLEGGLQEEIDRATTEMNLLLEGASPTTHRWHHEGKKLALLACFERHGVEFRGDALLCGAERDADDRVAALLVATEAGLERLRARAYIDSTGDGDLCAQAGAEFVNGRSGDGRSLAYSQPAFVWKAEAEPGGGGRVATRNYDAGWTDPADPEDLSRARLLGVAQHWRARWSEDCPLAIAPLPGLRQSRHIRADHVLSFRDLAGGARFADAIGEAGSIADTHSVDYEFEDDEAVFFFWVCRLFRRPLRSELPYRMLLPRGLRNVWIACRAAGIAPTAFYAVRMQRDMQRLGEAAGAAAALAVRDETDSRGIDLAELRLRLGLAEPGPVAPEDDPAQAAGDDVALLAAGRPGAHLWRLYCSPDTRRDAVLAELRGGGPDASFHAAVLLAMWADATAEPRLVAALAAREEGPPPSPDNTGAHGQEIDVPFWFIALVLLRRCGTTACLPELEKLAARADNILNVRTAAALTVERLADDGRISRARALGVADALLAHPVPDRFLAPSHSIWRRLRGEPQLVLRNDCGADTRQDHSWQLHLVAARIRLAAGAPAHEEARAFLDDPRATVRLAFRRLLGEKFAKAATAAS